MNAFNLFRHNRIKMGAFRNSMQEPSMQEHRDNVEELETVPPEYLERTAYSFEAFRKSLQIR